jgi:DNA-binding GntR family transcriptional regulator
MSESTVPKRLDIVLDRTSPVPLYHQLAQAIEAAIAAGDLSPGDRLENELSLTSRLGLARPTARQAIGELARKGLVVRKRGVGTQVLSRQINRETRLSSLYDDLAASGRHPQTQLLSYQIGPPDDDVLSCGAEVDETAEFLTIKRLRLAPKAALTAISFRRPAPFANIRFATFAVVPPRYLPNDVTSSSPTPI